VVVSYEVVVGELVEDDGMRRLELVGALEPRHRLGDAPVVAVECGEPYKSSKGTT